jgi:hypothetical protein
VETPPPAEEQPPPKKKRDTEDETPPGLAASKGKSDEAPAAEEKPSKKKRKLKKLASRSEEAPAADTADATIVKDNWTSRGKIYLSPGVRAGIGILSQRFTSNGTGSLSNYEASTNAFGAQLGLGVYGTVGKYGLLGGDASYTFIGAAGIRYIQPTDGSAVTLAVQAHTIDGGISAGVHFGVLGGLALRFRIGGQMVLNLIQPDVSSCRRIASSA